MEINGIDILKKVSALVAEDTSRANIFDHYKIDYCCGGDISLKDVCSKQEIDLEAITSEIRIHDDQKRATDGIDLNQLSLVELIDHIEEVHHTFLKKELPIIQDLLIKVVAHHSDSQLQKLKDVVTAFTKDIYSHMENEEMVLFPMIRQISNGNFASSESEYNSIKNLIETLVREHDVAKDFLLSIRTLTNDYTAPETACMSFQTLFQKLKELELDMHRHVHKENHVLFPQALYR